MTYTIRPAKKEELKIMVEWAASEGWNPGLYDADSFYTIDPQGFFLGFLDDEPVACLSAVSHNQDFGFLGFYIVKPEYRNKGYGLKLWKEALKHLPTQNIGLDGVVAQQENYKKSGFKLAYGNIRYEGKGMKSLSKDDRNIILLVKIPFEKLSRYDKTIFPASRDLFLKEWIKQPESLSVGYLKNNQLLGYGMIRKCRNGYKIGPLFANSQKIAKSLLDKLRNFISEDQLFYIDVPEVNKKAVALVESYQMKPIFKTARMYTKEFPQLPLHKIFGVTTLEVG